MRKRTVTSVFNGSSNIHQLNNLFSVHYDRAITLGLQIPPATVNSLDHSESKGIYIQTRTVAKCVKKNYFFLKNTIYLHCVRRIRL